MADEETEDVVEDDRRGRSTRSTTTTSTRTSRMPMISTTTSSTTTWSMTTNWSTRTPLSDDDDEDEDEDRRGQGPPHEARRDEDEDEDEEADPDDVEADLDEILKDRIAAGDDEDEEDEEELDDERSSRDPGQDPAPALRRVPVPVVLHPQASCPARRGRGRPLRGLRLRATGMAYRRSSSEPTDRTSAATRRRAARSTGRPPTVPVW